MTRTYNIIMALKPCPPGSKRDTRTKRCRMTEKAKKEAAVKRKAALKKKTPKKKALVPCPPGSKRNLSTNRCRKIPVTPNRRPKTPAVSISNSMRRSSRPISVKILKPGTTHKSTAHRERVCIMKKSEITKISKKLKIGQKFNAQLRRTKDTCRAFENVFPQEILPEGWRVTKYEGAGAFGAVLGTRGPNHASGALKVIIEKDIRKITNETTMSEEFHRIGLSPISKRITSIRMNDKYYHFLHMKRIDGVIGEHLSSKPTNSRMELLVSGLFDIIARLKKNNLLHGDLHLDNVAYVVAKSGSKGYLQVIDHGFSKKGMSIPKLEIVQILRGLYIDYDNKDITRATFNHMVKLVTKKAEKIYGFSFPDTEDKLDKLRSKIEQEHGIR